MGQTSRTIQDLMCGGLVQEVSKAKYFNILPSNHSCDILVNKMACLLLLSKVKSFGLIVWLRKSPKSLM